MKQFTSCLIAIVVLTICMIVFGQDPVPMPKLPVDKDTKLITYTDVIEMQGTKDELYIRGMEWVNSYYPNPQGVTKIMDKENGKIEGIANMRVYDFDKNGNKTPSSIISYTITLDFKDGKYRYTLTAFNVKGVSRFPLERWTNIEDPAYSLLYNNYLVQIDENIKDLIKKLKEGMKPKVVKKDDW